MQTWDELISKSRFFTGGAWFLAFIVIEVGNVPHFVCIYLSAQESNQ